MSNTFDHFTQSKVYKKIESKLSLFYHILV